MNERKDGGGAVAHVLASRREENGSRWSPRTSCPRGGEDRGRPGSRIGRRPHRTERRRRAGFTFVLLVVAWGIVGVGCQRGDAQNGASGGSGGGGRPGGPGGARAVPVEVARVELGAIARSLVVSGVVEPIRSVAVNSQMSGALLMVAVEEGTAVRSGQVLARLDDRELQAGLAAAEAAFQVAESAHVRAQQLRDRQVITLPEYERDRTAHAAAKAELDQIRTRLGYATIAAPSAGVVTEKRVEAGDIVANQSRLFTIADLSTMVVRVQVSELDVVSVAPGDAVQVALDAYPGEELVGRVRRVFPSADPTTRLVPVEVAIEDEAARLARPGFLARVTFALGTHENVLLVPASALLGDERSQSVFVVADGKATRRDVTTGLISKGMVEVVSGLTAAESVVVVGNTTLQDGATVRVLGAEGTRTDPARGGAGAAPVGAGAAPVGAGAGGASPEKRG